jgi:hypothetical protein
MPTQEATSPTTTSPTPTLITRRYPKRNIVRVDYTGMDTIEPYGEDDGITNIWADETIREDPDYVPYEYKRW